MPSNVVSLPQARIPIGSVVIEGRNYPVEVSIDWMLAFTGLLDRSGGTSGDTSFTQYINQFFDAPLASSESQEATRAIDELRNALESSRGDLQALRSTIEQMQDETRLHRDYRNRIERIEDQLINAPRLPDDYRSRIETLEDRLQ